MLRILLQGIGLGLIIAISIGPAFFATIQTGIDRGFKYGVFFASGILLSDLTLIALCYFGLTGIFDANENKVYIGIIGGLVLIGFGLFTFFKKPESLRQRKQRTPNAKLPVKSKNPSLIKYIAQGYFLNILNPFLIIFWLAAMSFVSANAEEGKLGQYALTFFSGTLATVFATDLLKSYIGNKIKKLLRLRYIILVNRIVGIVMMASGIVLFIRVYLEFIQ
jgi:threonine/homoserine/homoserine lactone efflux protein